MNDLLLYLIAKDHSFDDKNVSQLQFLYAPPLLPFLPENRLDDECNSVIIISNDDEKQSSGVIIIDL